jgi:hypothetical protein
MIFQRRGYVFFYPLDGDKKKKKGIERGKQSS